MIKKKIIGILIMALLVTTSLTTVLGNNSMAQSVQKKKSLINTTTDNNIGSVQSDYYLSEDFTDDYWNYLINNAAFTDTGTYFFASYDSELEWIKETGNGAAYAKTNPNTGSVNTYGHAWIGEGRAEARSTINFYIGRQKDISIKGHTISFGGTVLVPPAAVSSTSMTMMVDNDPDKWWHEDIDAPFDEDWFIGELLWFCQLLGYAGGSMDIVTLIDFLNTIHSTIDLLDAFEQVNGEDKDEVSITKYFTMGQGTHYASVGVRSDAVGGGIGYAFAARVGIVDYIYVNGIAPPYNPAVYGSWGTQVNTPYNVHFHSYDPNDDDVQYKIDWGDGTITDWSNFYTHNTEKTESHLYTEVGYYTIKVKARDIDLMESDWGSFEIRIEGDSPCPVAIITSGPSGPITYNDVSFTWTGTDDLDPPEDLVYQYILEGYDSGWSSWTSSTIKTYNNLPNGEYTFKVKAKDTIGYIGGIDSRFFIISNPGTAIFGQTTYESSGTGIENYMEGSRFPMGDTYGEAESITVLLSCSESAKNVKCAIYGGDGPYFDLVGETEEILVPTCDRTWYTFNFETSKPKLKSNTEYILVAWADDGDGNIWIWGRSPSGYYNLWGVNEYYDDYFPDPQYLYNSDEYDWQFSIFCRYTEKNFPPEVETKYANDRDCSSATLRGELKDLGGISSSQVWFEWGTTSAYGHSTNQQTKTEPCNFAQSISNLNPDTTYHFRACASNGQVSYGDDKTFKTLKLPDVDVNPNDLNFGELKPGETETKSITVENVAGCTLYWATTNQPNWITNINPDNGQLGAGESTTVQIKATAPNTPGINYNAEFYIINTEDNSDSETVTVHLEVEGPKLDVHPTTLDFVLDPNQEDTQSIIIENIGSGTLEWEIDFPNQPDWITEINPSDGSIEGGLSNNCYITITAPDDPGEQYDCDFDIKNINDPSMKQNILIHLDINTPGIGVDPRTLNFDDLPPNQQDTKSITIENTGSLTLNWEIDFPNQPNWVTNIGPPTSGTLEPGETQDVEITVTALDNPGGNFNCTFYVKNSDDFSMKVEIEIKLHVAGPEIKVTPNNINLDLEPGEHIDASITIKNDGIYGLLEWNIAEDINWITDVSPGQGTCIPGESDIVDLTGTAPVDGGDYTEEIYVTSNGGDVTVTIDLHVEGPNLYVSPIKLDFNSLSPNEDAQKTLSIKNIGKGTLDWNIDTTNLPEWITSISPSSGSCKTDDVNVVTVKVKAPDKNGVTRDTIIYVTSNGGNKEISIHLSTEKSKTKNILIIEFLKKIIELFPILEKILKICSVIKTSYFNNYIIK